MSVGRNLNAMSGHGIINKLVVLVRKPVEAFLDNVIPVQVFDEGDDVKGESANNGNDLVVVLRISLELENFWW